MALSLSLTIRTPRETRVELNDCDINPTLATMSKALHIWPTSVPDTQSKWYCRDCDEVMEPGENCKKCGKPQSGASACPKCHDTVTDLKYCPRCNAPEPIDHWTLAAEHNAGSDNLLLNLRQPRIISWSDSNWRCEKCGKQVADGMRFCSECEKKQNTEQLRHFPYGIKEIL
ncbi:hypothetical protein F4859DRAFT_363202 [Xylaria cf. heliscus]|nr:hypothetical protein F4859DRAFT_363202 [Xylaria cf. heliscus]